MQDAYRNIMQTRIVGNAESTKIQEMLNNEFGKQLRNCGSKMRDKMPKEGKAWIESNLNEVANIVLETQSFQKRIERVVEMLQKDGVLTPDGKRVTDSVVLNVVSEGKTETPAFVYLVGKLGDSQRLQKRAYAATIELRHYVAAVWLEVVSCKSKNDDYPDGKTFNFRSFFYPLGDNWVRILHVRQNAILLSLLDDYTKVAERPTKGKTAEAEAIRRGEDALKKQRESYEHQIRKLKEDHAKEKKVMRRDAEEKLEKQRAEMFKALKTQDTELYGLRKENELMRAQLELLNWPGALVITPDTLEETQQPESGEKSADEQMDTLEVLPELPEDNVVFFGGSTNMQKKLRQIYPNWSFIGSEGISSSYSIPTNPCVVFLWTNHMSHGMQCSVNARVGDAEKVYVTRTNLDALIREMKIGYKKIKEDKPRND